MTIYYFGIYYRYQTGCRHLHARLIITKRFRTFLETFFSYYNYYVWSYYFLSFFFIYIYLYCIFKCFVHAHCNIIIPTYMIVYNVNFSFVIKIIYKYKILFFYTNTFFFYNLILTFISLVILDPLVTPSPKSATWLSILTI